MGLVLMGVGREVWLVLFGRQSEALWGFSTVAPALYSPHQHPPMSILGAVPGGAVRRPHHSAAPLASGHGDLAALCCLHKVGLGGGVGGSLTPNSPLYFVASLQKSLILKCADSIVEA